MSWILEMLHAITVFSVSNRQPMALVFYTGMHFGQGKSSGCLKIGMQCWNVMWYWKIADGLYQYDIWSWSCGHAVLEFFCWILVVSWWTRNHIKICIGQSNKHHASCNKETKLMELIMKRVPTIILCYLERKNSELRKEKNLWKLENCADKWE